MKGENEMDVMMLVGIALAVIGLIVFFMAFKEDSHFVANTGRIILAISVIFMIVGLV